MNDITEPLRRALVATINEKVQTDDTETELKRLKVQYGEGQVWDTKEMSARFEVLGFMAPFCIVREKVSGKKGSIMFQHMPRFYFGWQEN